MTTNNSKDQYQALVETSRVVAHDLSAQLHVLQFCIEELNDFVIRDGHKYLAQMKTTAENLGNVLNTYRKTIKINFEEGEETSLDDIFQGAVELINNHYHAQLPLLVTSFDNRTQTKIMKHQLELMHLFFSLMAVTIDFHQDTQFFDVDSLKLNMMVKEIGPNQLEIVFTHIGDIITKDKFLEELDKNRPAKGELRKFIGLNYLKELISSGKAELNLEEATSNKITLRAWVN